MLFHDIVFGPIHSRRLGASLGVNLLPSHGKWCNFDCIYCECGWNADGNGDKKLPLKEEVVEALEQKLSELANRNNLPDVITFSGNGEPTLHPDFKSIIEATVGLRNRYAPHAKVCVLSNATQLHRTHIFEALCMVDKRILKIDSAFLQTIQKINQPAPDYDLTAIVEAIKRFKGDFTLQTLFLQGESRGATIDNTTSDEVTAWLQLIGLLQPKEVMIYTIDRETPAKNLEKIPRIQLEALANRVKSLNMNIEINVAG